MRFGGSTTPVDWLVVGLGNPGPSYERSPHNVGFRVARELIDRWGLGRPRKKYAAELAEGRTGPGGPRVAVLLPQTFMNESGRSAGPARGAYRLPPPPPGAGPPRIDPPLGENPGGPGGGPAGANR